MVERGGRIEGDEIAFFETIGDFDQVGRFLADSHLAAHESFLSGHEANLPAPIGFDRLMRDRQHIFPGRNGDVDPRRHSGLEARGNFVELDDADEKADIGLCPVRFGFDSLRDRDLADRNEDTFQNQFRQRFKADRCARPGLTLCTIDSLSTTCASISDRSGR